MITLNDEEGTRLFSTQRIALWMLMLAMLGLMAANPSPGNTQTATPQASATPDMGQEITFKGENNLVIQAVYYPAPQTPAPTLILLNFRHRWSNWATHWSQRGVNVVAIDELIYNVGGSLDDMNREDIHNIVLVMQQLDNNPAVSPHRFAVMGGSLMGGYALEGCAITPECQTAILLSPTDTAIDLPDPMATLGKRPVLIVASKGEVGIADVAQRWDQQARGDHQLILYDWGFHATSMFYAHPELVDTVGDWLTKYLVDVDF